MQGLTKDEAKIIELVSAAKKIRNMTHAELDLWSPALLLKIHVITGWTLPSGERYNIIEDQFRKLLTDEYGNMNPEEIEHAFRTLSHTVEDWGKNMNLGLINTILKPYLSKRHELSYQVERMNPADDGYCAASSLAWYRETIEMNYRRYLAGEHVTPYWYWYDVLVQDRFIEPSFYKTGLKQLQGTAQGTDQDLAKEAKRGAVLYLFSVAKGKRLQHLYKKTA